jgi:hypothetical protein
VAIKGSWTSGSRFPGVPTSLLLPFVVGGPFSISENSRLRARSVQRVTARETSGSHMAGREFFPDRSESASKSTDGCYLANRVQS